MYVARVLYPVNVLGIGNRVGIWTSICKHKCIGCSNPELWESNESQKVSVKDLFNTINQINNYKKIDGFTITGGDPFYQVKDLRKLIDKLLLISDDIIIYTGFTIEELKRENDEDINYILSHITVLIDGRYKQELNDNSFMVGSSNQRKLILNEKYKEVYESYFASNTNQIQNFMFDDGIVSVGIHSKDFDEKVRKEFISKNEKQK